MVRRFNISKIVGPYNGKAIFVKKMKISCSLDYPILFMAKIVTAFLLQMLVTARFNKHGRVGT